jgi:CheY-like chemotaxis protein/anti-sigma regulatory factor (Ser/Thr protein kinase)
MNAIIGMTAIGKSSQDIEKKNDALNKIDAASRHLLGVINDILDMSKIEADKLELSHAGFKFEDMLQKVANVINFRVDERRQKFYVKIGKDIPDALTGDDQRLSQVITNLLGNAVKFTPDGGTIRLNTKIISIENDICRLQISVEDTGIGITDEQKSRLFRSFEQAEAHTSRKFGGTGLGLAISKRIIEMMDGEIWVESEPGKGSKFIFTVSLKCDTKNKKRMIDESVNWKNICKQHSVRIFVLDDEPEILELFTGLSETWGIACTAVANGKEALEMLEKDNEYDIYFIDWALPGMNSIELTQRIQEKAAHKSVVIIYSSIDWHIIEDETRAAGISKFLPKPLFPSAIAGMINKCMGIDNNAGHDNKSGYTDDFSGYSILLAEDIEINREIVLTLLEPTSLNIDCAENGIQAFEIFSAAPEKYDMIFMDVQMPEMDGYEATRQIRAYENEQWKKRCTSLAESETRSNNRNSPGKKSVEFAEQTPKLSEFSKRIPIIAMTANVFREDIDKCMAAGMNGHVGKPINFDEVISQLRKYLHRPN